RRVAKWSGLLTCAVILLAFAISQKWSLEWVGSDNPEFELMRGAVRVAWLAPDWHVVPHDGEPQPRWILASDYEGSPLAPIWCPQLVTEQSLRGAIVPLWIPFLIFAIPTAIIWYRDCRRIPPGHCPHCGYNLNLNVSGQCPECGKMITAGKI